MRKKLFIFITLTLMINLILSCSVHSGVITKGDLKSTKNSIEGNYDNFNGKFYKKVKLNKGDKLNFTVNNTINSGELKLLLMDKDDNVLVDLNNSNNFEIKDSGYYFFTALANDHSGDFKVQWKKTK